MTNIEILTARLNACKNRRRIFNMLQSLACEPGVQNPKDVREHVEIALIQDVAFPEVTGAA